MSRHFVADADLVFGKKKERVIVEGERRCACRTKLQRYNKGKLCAVCERRAFDQFHGRADESTTWNHTALPLPGLTRGHVVEAVCLEFFLSRMLLLGRGKLPIESRIARRILSYLQRADVGGGLREISSVFVARSVFTIREDSHIIEKGLADDRRLQAIVVAVRRRYPTRAQQAFIERGGKL